MTRNSSPLKATHFIFRQNLAIRTITRTMFYIKIKLFSDELFLFIPFLPIVDRVSFILICFHCFFSLE